MTQGIISITKNNKVLFKCIAGCNGMTVKNTSNELEKVHDLSEEIIYNICINNDFGCKDCLVIQSSRNSKLLSVLYQNTFNDPKFNPISDYGNCFYTEIITL